MTLPEEIRAALAAGDFGRAARCFEVHAANLLAGIQTGGCGTAEIARAGELLIAARAARVHLRVRLQAMEHQASVAQSYLSSGRMEFQRPISCASAVPSTRGKS